MEALPADHLRALRDGLPLFDQYGLLLAGGYALRAHHAVQRPSQDLDLATGGPLALETVAEAIAVGYRAQGYGVAVIEANPLMARLTLTLPDDRGGSGSC